MAKIKEVSLERSYKIYLGHYETVTFSGGITASMEDGDVYSDVYDSLANAIDNKIQTDIDTFVNGKDGS